MTNSPLTPRNDLRVSGQTQSKESEPIAAPELSPLALRAKDAARVLGIGSTLLWSMTNRGEIPFVRIGRAIVYPIASLQKWLADQAAKGGRR